MRLRYHDPPAAAGQVRPRAAPALQFVALALQLVALALQLAPLLPAPAQPLARRGTPLLLGCWPQPP